jgi:hypothetical protein
VKRAGDNKGLQQCELQHSLLCMPVGAFPLTNGLQTVFELGRSCLPACITASSILSTLFLPNPTADLNLQLACSSLNHLDKISCTTHLWLTPIADCRWESPQQV